MNNSENLSSVFLTTKGKLEYNLTWLQTYREKVVGIQKDMKEELEGARVRLFTLKFDENWMDRWEAWKPKRSISSLLDGIVFYEHALAFLQSKQAEIQLLLLVDKDPETIDPVKLAQHQVQHQTLLDKMEKASPPDCEEMLAEIERGMYMVTCDDDEHEVMFKLKSPLISKHCFVNLLV